MGNILQHFVGLVDILRQNMHFALMMIAILWAIHLVNWLLRYRLNVLGITPRTLHGIPGIVIAPFLHGHFDHLFFNSIPLFILGSFVMIPGLNTFILVTALIVLLGGTATWLLGRRAIHIGASGVIMGYLGYLLMSAFHQETAVSIGIGFVCIYYFGSMLLDLFPSDIKTSWEGHLFGFASGIATAYLAPLLMPWYLEHFRHLIH